MTSLGMAYTCKINGKTYKSMARKNYWGGNEFTCRGCKGRWYLPIGSEGWRAKTACYIRKPEE